MAFFCNALCTEKASVVFALFSKMVCKSGFKGNFIFAILLMKYNIAFVIFAQLCFKCIQFLHTALSKPLQKKNHKIFTNIEDIKTFGQMALYICIR
jgi:hypothetical protein